MPSPRHTVLPAVADKVVTLPFGDRNAPAIVALLASRGELQVFRPDPATLGAFLQAQVIAVPGATDLLVGDANVDTRLDLLVPDAAGVTWLVQEASALTGFAAPVRTAIAGLTAVALGDHDSDGRDDVLVAVSGTTNVQLLISRFDQPGALRPAVSLFSLAAVTRLLSADMSGDGRPDVIAVQGATGDVRVRTRRNTAGFVYADRASASVGGAVAEVLTAELHGPSVNGLIVRRDDGRIFTGRLQPTTSTLELREESTAAGEALVVADLDDNGVPDLLTVTRSPDRIQRILVERARRGPLRFNMPGLDRTSTSATSQNDRRYEDLDSDGLLDRLSYDSRSGFTSAAACLLEFGRGDGGFGRQRSLPSIGLKSSQFADFNGDGLIDIAEFGTFSGITGIRFRPGDSSSESGFGSPVMTSIPALVSQEQPFGRRQTMPLGDRTGVLIVEDDNGAMAVALWQHDPSIAGAFVRVATVLEDIENPSGFEVVARDIDHDGLTDVLFDQSNGPTRIARRLPADGHLFAEAPIVPDSFANSDTRLTDVNGDGRVDLFARSGSVHVSIWLQQPGDALTFASPMQFSSSAGELLFDLADLNGDGRSDLVLGRSGRVTYQLAEATGSFGPEVEVIADGAALFLRVADVVGDARPDLVTGFLGDTSTLFDDSLRIFPAGNSSLGMFDPPNRIVLRDRMADVVLADVDNDGHRDLITAGRILFSRDRRIDVPITPDEIGGLAYDELNVLDVDDDGRDEILAGDTTSGTFLRRPSADGGPDRAPPVTLAGLSSPFRFQRFGDFDGDGTLDLVALLTDSAELRRVDEDFAVTAVNSVSTPSLFSSAFLQLRRSARAHPDQLIFSSGTNIGANYPVFSLDLVQGVVREPDIQLRLDGRRLFNRDGRDDVFMDASSAGDPVVYLQQPAGTFLQAPTFGTNSSGDARVGDVNGDGLLDIVFRDLDTLRVFVGSETMPGQHIPGAAVSTASRDSFEMADLNGDGRLELVREPESATGELFAALEIRSTAAGSSATLLATSRRLRGLVDPVRDLYVFGDWDGDGLREIFYTAGDTLVHASADDDKLPNQINSWRLGSEIRSFAVADFDGDGTIEVVVLFSNLNLQILRQE